MTLCENEVQTEVQAADADATHAVDILAFVEAEEIPSLYFERPYYLAPAPGGEQLYALLRETLRSTRKIGIAYVVIQAHQHLAALMPRGQSLVLQTLRWKREERWLGMTAPAEQTMKTKKSPDIVIQDMEGLIEDDDPIDDDLLEYALRRRPHPRACQASRASAGVHARTRMRPARARRV